MAAGETQPQVNPRVSRVQALLTAGRVRLYISNLVHVLTLFHVFAFPGLLNGIRTAKEVSPARDLKLISPWWLLIMRYAVSSPRPLPSPTGFVVKKRLKNPGLNFQRDSRTVVHDFHNGIVLHRGWLRMRGFPFPFMPSMAFVIRLVQTWLTSLPRAQALGSVRS
jgi:hypothetical protein